MSGTYTKKKKHNLTENAKLYEKNDSSPIIHTNRWGGIKAMWDKMDLGKIYTQNI